MGKVSKKRKAILEKYDLQKDYPLTEAAEAVKEMTSNLIKMGHKDILMILLQHTLLWKIQNKMGVSPLEWLLWPQQFPE